MASSTQQTIKQEPSLPSSSTSEQSIKDTTIQEEYSVTPTEEDETFEQFYSEVIHIWYN
jgi:hypothetical protein